MTIAGLGTGQKTFNFGIKVPDEKAEEVEAAIRNHAQWMRDTHSLDDSKIRLVHYYASKSPSRAARCSAITESGTESAWPAFADIGYP